MLKLETAVPECLSVPLRSEELHHDEQLVAWVLVQELPVLVGAGPARPHQVAADLQEALQAGVVRSEAQAALPRRVADGGVGPCPQQRHHHLRTALQQSCQTCENTPWNHKIIGRFGR